MHDNIETDGQTVEALPGIIEGLKRRGYHLVTITARSATSSCSSGSTTITAGSTRLWGQEASSQPVGQSVDLARNRTLVKVPPEPRSRAMQLGIGSRAALSAESNRRPRGVHTIALSRMESSYAR